MYMRHTYMMQDVRFSVCVCRVCGLCVCGVCGI